MADKPSGGQMEAKIVGVLQRYDALQFEELKSVVFEDGSFSNDAERDLESALARLVEDGTLRSPGKFGPFQLTRGAAGPSPAATRKPSAIRGVRSVRSSLR